MKWKLIIMAGFLVGLASAAWAQNETTGPANSGQGNKHYTLEQRLQQRFNKIDTNGDGQISQAEYQAFIAQRQKKREQQQFSKMDTDGNGQISLAEYQAFVKQKVENWQRREGNGQSNWGHRRWQRGGGQK